jgi:hypothetical protein
LSSASSTARRWSVSLWLVAPLDKAAHHHALRRGLRDAGRLPVGAGGKAEQQEALRDGEVGGESTVGVEALAIMIHAHAASARTGGHLVLIQINTPFAKVRMVCSMWQPTSTRSSFWRDRLMLLRLELDAIWTARVFDDQAERAVLAKIRKVLKENCPNRAGRISANAELRVNGYGVEGVGSARRQGNWPRRMDGRYEHA